ncbi:hypothetical protein [Streptomyces chartreusis]|nr:hypothetical protein [Streptomyces chartreusis]GGW98578.1 hypothetical protein GCM10010321_11180 [Streptomyces chartreusis]
MNTAATITAIIAAVVVINIIVTAIRDTAAAKHKTCPNCGRDKTKENSA